MNKQLISVNISTKIIRRCKSELFRPGGGIRSVADIEAERKHEAETADDPMSYTIFGNKRKPKIDPFFYSDRKAGRGYTDYSNENYPERRYICQPLRKYYKLNWYLMAVVLVIFLFDIES